MYAKDSKTGGQAVQIELSLPKGVKASGEWIKPIGIPSIKNQSDMILEGFGNFEKKLTRNKNAAGAIQVKISYQVCDERMCLPPTTITKTVSVAK